MESYPNLNIHESDLKLIGQYFSMSEGDLIEKIERDLNFRDAGITLSDAIYWLGPLIRGLLERLKGTYPSTSTENLSIYPTVFNDTKIVMYVKEVQQAVCKDGRLCKICSKSSLSLEEKAKYVAEIMRNDSNLTRYKTRSIHIQMAVLIVKVGSQRFCKCQE